MAWEWLTHRGTAQTLHDLVPPAPWRRRVWVLDATDRSLVLGSTQRPATIDADAARQAGFSVSTRRSGGGVVVVGPGECLWVDVFLPRDDPRWTDDVGAAAQWLGLVWQRALADVGVVTTRVHDGPMIHTADSRLVCFAGVGAGEVFVGDAKVVGISQRRRRDGARFQCAVPLRWQPATWIDLLRPSPTTDLTSVAMPVAVAPDDLVAAFRRHLPT